MKVYLLTTGDGSDGNEWAVRGIYATREIAEAALSMAAGTLALLDHYQRPKEFWARDYEIEEWDVRDRPEDWPQG